MNVKRDGRWHTDDEKLPWSRGMKISLSFSCPEEMYAAISDLQLEKRVKLSAAIQQLVRWGLIYKGILEEPPTQKPQETRSSKPKKKAKPKTPSK